MTTVFLDAERVILLNFLPKRSTITGVYYANLQDQLRTVIREKRRSELSKGVLLQQDNARVHTSKAAMDAVKRISIFLYTYTCGSWILTADLEKRTQVFLDEMLQEVIEHFVQGLCYQ